MDALTLQSLSDSLPGSSTGTVQALSQRGEIPGVSQVVPGRARSPDAILVRRFPPVALVDRSKRRVAGCLVLALALRWLSARAEDTALLKSNRSAVSGAKTEERAAGFLAAARPSSLLRDWPLCDKLSRHDAATFRTGSPSSRANDNPSKFHFTVNQYTTATARSRRSLSKVKPEGTRWPRSWSISPMTTRAVSRP